MEPGVRTPVMPGGPLPSPNKLPSRASPCQPSMGRTIYRRVSRAATEGGPACLPACPRYSERCPKGALGTSRGAAAGSVAERSGVEDFTEAETMLYRAASSCSWPRSQVSPASRASWAGRA